jgi:hypothetical protein
MNWPRVEAVTNPGGVDEMSPAFLTPAILEIAPFGATQAGTGIVAGVLELGELDHLAGGELVCQVTANRRAAAAPECARLQASTNCNPAGAVGERVGRAGAGVVSAAVRYPASSDHLARVRAAPRFRQDNAWGGGAKGAPHNRRKDVG